MPVIQQLINFDRMIAQLQESPVIINDMSNVSEEEKASVRALITTRYSSDMLSIMPSCECGETRGEYAIGTLCNSCHKPVKSVVSEDIEPIVWFRAPHGVAKLMSPIIWIMLDKRFKKSGFSVMQWLTDTTYKAKVKQPRVIDQLNELGIRGGYNYFVENFDRIMDVLFGIKDFQLKRGKRDYLRELLQLNRDSIFSNYLPLPNKALLVIEKTNVGIYVDMTIIDAIDAIETVVSIDNPMTEHSIRTKENRTAKTIAKLSSFYEEFTKTNLSSKAGVFRKHMFGSRTHFSFRAVITSLTDAHQYDEIHVPWGVGVAAFRPHLINRLLRRGYDHNQAIGFLYAHVEKYHPTIDEIFHEFIAESRDKGLPCILQRNPSLLQGSAQLVRITKFKPDPTDHTVAISILIVRSMNADFDGDALNLSIAIDNEMADHWKALAPHRNVFVLNEPRKISDNIAIPKPVVSTMANWIRSRTDQQNIDPQKLANFNMLADA
jgi:hypothetical protein